MPKGYKNSQTSIHYMCYHFVWCPKYRRPVLIGEVKKMARQIIEKKAKELGCEIQALEIMPDHIHLFIQATPLQSPNYLVAQFKGITSHQLRKKFKHLLKLPTLWTRSYFVSTHGHISDTLIKKYIEEQKGI